MSVEAGNGHMRGPSTLLSTFYYFEIVHSENFKATAERGKQQTLLYIFLIHKDPIATS